MSRPRGALFLCLLELVWYDSKHEVRYYTQGDIPLLFRMLYYGSVAAASASALASASVGSATAAFPSP